MARRGGRGADGFPERRRRRHGGTCACFFSPRGSWPGARVVRAAWKYSGVIFTSVVNESGAGDGEGITYHRDQDQNWFSRLMEGLQRSNKDHTNRNDLHRSRDCAGSVRTRPVYNIVTRPIINRYAASKCAEKKRGERERERIARDPTFCRTKKGQARCRLSSEKSTCRETGERERELMRKKETQAGANTREGGKKEGEKE